jgi:alkylated DNA repair protein (DNA oxidative demethylase)
MEQLSLLPKSSPPGFQYFPDFITPIAETKILQAISQVEWSEVRMHGVAAKRRVVHYGVNYFYDTRSTEPAQPPPAFLQPLLIDAARALAISPAAIAEVLLTEYAVGAGIGWHRDAKMFGDAVLGVSLGGPCVMRFRKPSGDGYLLYKAELEPRSAYIISGPARWEWYHHIPPVKSVRWSVTCRTLLRPV